MQNKILNNILLDNFFYTNKLVHSQYDNNNAVSEILKNYFNNIRGN